MAEPPACGLRPARRRGLTSPEPVRTPTAATATRPPTPAQEPGQAAEKVSGATPAPGFTPENSSCRNQTGNGLSEWAGGSRLRSRRRRGAAPLARRQRPGSALEGRPAHAGPRAPIQSTTVLRLPIVQIVGTATMRPLRPVACDWLHVEHLRDRLVISETRANLGAGCAGIGRRSQTIAKSQPVVPSPRTRQSSSARIRVWHRL
jgi:hypothetical protein